MATVFISYGRECQEKVTSLAQDLGALGHQAWLDRELTGGQAWWDQILLRIRGCEVFAYALSPESLDSPACKREYSYASKLGKSLLPVLVAEGVSIDLLPSALAQVQYVDYRREDKEALKALSRALAALPRSPALPEPLPEPPAAPVSYLGSLADQVGATEPMPFPEQTGLLLRLKHGLSDKRDAEHVRTLLRRFRSRDDLLAKVADEIDVLLGSVPVSRDAPIESNSDRVRSRVAEPEAAARPDEKTLGVERNGDVSKGTVDHHVSLGRRVLAAISTVLIGLVAGFLAGSIAAQGTRDGDAALGIAIAIWISGLIVGVIAWRRGRVLGLRPKRDRSLR